MTTEEEVHLENIIYKDPDEDPRSVVTNGV